MALNSRAKGVGTLLLTLTALANFAGFGCSSAKKTEPELRRLEGKRISLIEIEGEKTARTITEVALINQLAERGTFILVGKKELEAARADASTSAVVTRADRLEIARKVGAEYALRISILQFDAKAREGYSAVEEEDSQLAAERGADQGKTQRHFKVKSLTGEVRLRLEFTHLEDPLDVRSAIAEHRDEIVAEAKTGGAHLPPRLRFLEGLTNEAFRLFFTRYQ